MGDISRLIDRMWEELGDALHYAKCYVSHKDEDQFLAKKYYEMAQDEIKHSMYIHDMIADKINNNEDERLSDALELLWDYKHQEYVDKITEIKIVLAM